MTLDLSGRIVHQRVGGNSYRLVRLLGSGSEAPVYEGRLCTNEHEAVAIKVFDPESDRGLAGEHAAKAKKGRYIGLPKGNPNLVEYLDWFEGPEPLVDGAQPDSGAMTWRYLVCSLVNGLNLSAFASHHPGDLRPIASAAKGLWALHESGRVHGDVKPANIVVDTSTPVPEGCVVDLGSICRIGRDEFKRIGTVGYASPRITSEAPAPEHDAYSLAVTALTLIEPDLYRTGPGTFQESLDLLVERLDLFNLAPASVGALRASLNHEPLEDGVAARFAPLVGEAHAAQSRPVEAPPEMSPSAPTQVYPGPDASNCSDAVTVADPTDEASGASVIEQPASVLVGPEGILFSVCLWVLRSRNLPAALVAAVVVGFLLGVVLESVV